MMLGLSNAGISFLIYILYKLCVQTGLVRFLNAFYSDSML